MKEIISIEPAENHLNRRGFVILSATFLTSLAVVAKTGINYLSSPLELKLKGEEGFREVGEIISETEAAQENCQEFVSQHQLFPLDKIYSHPTILEARNDPGFVDYYFPPLRDQRLLKRVIPQLRTLLSFEGRVRALFNPEITELVVKEVYATSEQEVSQGLCGWKPLHILLPIRGVNYLSMS